MYTIRKAVSTDAARINIITQKAFKIYQHELNSDAVVIALTETTIDVLNDIKHNNVFIAESENGEIIGTIRYCILSSELAYIYRFGVDPDISSTGVGSDLLNCVIADCEQKKLSAIALHTNSKYYKLARYYYGKQFFVHSTTTDKGYIRALFIKELNSNKYDISPALKK